MEWGKAARSTKKKSSRYLFIIEEKRILERKKIEQSWEKRIGGTDQTRFGSHAFATLSV